MFIKIIFVSEGSLLEAPVVRTCAGTGLCARVDYHLSREAPLVFSHPVTAIRAGMDDDPSLGGDHPIPFESPTAVQAAGAQHVS